MIEISSTLQTAAGAESRSPIFSVEAIQKRLDFKQVSTHPMYVVHRVVEGDGYWIATGYSSITPTSIYYQRFTDILSGWSSGWSSLVTGLPDAYMHDLWADGDDVVVAYWDDGVSGEPELWYITSSDGGQSWGSAALVYDPGEPSTYNVQGVSIVSDTEIWWSHGLAGTSVKQERLEKQNGSWLVTGFWTRHSTETFDMMDSASENAVKQMYARPGVGEYEEVLMFNSYKGFGDSDRWQGIFRGFINNYLTTDRMDTSMGLLETDLDYTYGLRGMSRDRFGGFYIGAILEVYGKHADVSGVTTESELFICRTIDGKAYELIPCNIAHNQDEPIDNCYFAGFVDDGSGNLLTVASYSSGSETDCRVMYAESSWFTGSDTGQAIEGDVIEPISIDRSVGVVTKAEIVLENQNGDYTIDDVVTEGNIIRIEAGYKTTLGDELQRRFTGIIASLNTTPAPNATARLSVYDNLFLASGKLGRPHVLKGQNTFRADFSIADNDKKMVHQRGVWAMSGDRLVQTEKNVNAFGVCGYDPDDLYTITAKFRVDGSITDVKVGLVVGYDPNEAYDRLYTVVCYNRTTNDIEFGYIDANGDYTLISTEQTGLGWSADTDYWMRVDRCHNLVNRVYYKTSASGTWVENTGTVGYTGTGTKEYPGIFCYVPSSGTSVSFDFVEVVGNELPITGSDVMSYLATTCGMSTDEKFTVSDDFDGSSFSDDWIEGPNGTWTIASSLAQGESGGSEASPAEACITTFRASDVVVRCSTSLRSSNANGLVLRSDCNQNRYEALCHRDYCRIAKVVGGSRTTLDTISVSFLNPVDEYCYITFAAIGNWLVLFVNDSLRCCVYDEDLEDGYVGILSANSLTYPSRIDDFTVNGFYKPIPGIVSIKQSNSAIAIMEQMAGLLPGGQFFCNEDGDLRWGVFPEDASADLDVENVVINSSVNRGTDRLLTNTTLVGNLAYANRRFSPWATRLSRHLSENRDEKLLSSGRDLYELAGDSMKQTYRISERSLEIRANPAIELCDIVTVENGTIYLLDTFTDSTGVTLTNHDPDIDLNGSGWEWYSGYAGIMTISADDTAVGSSTVQQYQIDVGIIDYVLEVDLGPAYDEVTVIFRKSPGVNEFYSIWVDPADDVVALGQNPGSTPYYIHDMVENAGIIGNGWYHIKVIVSKNNIVAFVSVYEKEYILTYFGADFSGTETEVGLLLKGASPEADNITVYTPDVNGQVLSLNETVGSVYEMAVPGLIGGEEYW